MPNHVHLIVTPADEDALRATFAEAHRRYTGAINTRFHWTGHLFQGRFGAVVMDEPHLLVAARYIALNPVVAGLVSRAEDWPWSSARAHLAGEDDELATVAPLRADPRFCSTSHCTGRPSDDGADRTGAHHRATAGGNRMGRSARAPARPRPCTRQTRPKAASARAYRARTAAAVRSRVNCHRNAE
jgi:hypothetical protein